MIILFGKAGAGKSQQGEILEKLLNWKWLSVGQVIRNTGKYTEITKTGGLVHDEDVVKLMAEEIDQAKKDGFKNVILDGYPRDVWQAEWLIKNGWAKEIELAIVLDAPENVLIERLKKRDREDDKDLNVVNKRFDIFEQNMCSIAKLLRENGIKTEKIDATGEKAEVTERIQNLLKENKII